MEDHLRKLQVFSLETVEGLIVRAWQKGLEMAADKCQHAYDRQQLRLMAYNPPPRSALLDELLPVDVAAAARLDANEAAAQACLTLMERDDLGIPHNHGEHAAWNEACEACATRIRNLREGW